MITIKEIRFNSAFEKLGAENIVGYCKANKGDKVQFGSITDKQKLYLKINGVEVIEEKNGWIIAKYE